MRVLQASTRGSGEINVTSDVEVLLMCGVIAMSTLLYSAIIANMSTLLLSSDQAWHDHRRKVEVLKAFMRHRRLPTRLRQRIQNYLDFLWTSSKGIDESQILLGESSHRRTGTLQHLLPPFFLL